MKRTNMKGLTIRPKTACPAPSLVIDNTYFASKRLDYQRVKPAVATTRAGVEASPPF
ncbi:hypothetical protein ACFL2Q_08380 [Thermodesulfobacteriota bacterium]